MRAIRFPIRMNGRIQEAECVWAIPPARTETTMLRAWANLRGSQPQIDAGQLATFAAENWTSTCRFGAVAVSMDQMALMVRENPKIEVTAMLLVRTGILGDGLLGACLFHRTWAGNLFLDFLVTNPATMVPDGRIGGVGAGLLYQLCAVAERLDAERLWIETTLGSVSFYQKLFELREAGDVIIPSRRERLAFCRDLDERWEIWARLDSDEGRILHEAMLEKRFKDMTLDEIFALEERYTALAGHSGVTQEGYERFQREVAKALGHAPAKPLNRAPRAKRRPAKAAVLSS